MSLVIAAERVPLAPDADGVDRVARSRVMLAAVVFALRQGATPEEMADRYPAIRLDHVHEVIGDGLRYREEVDVYLGSRAAMATDGGSAVEKAWPPQDLRDRPLARHMIPR